MDRGAVTEALYALPRAEFVAARDEQAKAARSGGDRELAAAIGKLRRPTSGAWLINQLARQRPAGVHDLTELGAALRAAHRGLDGTALRDLSRRRQALVSDLLSEARKLGQRAGQPVSEAVARELEEMFTAALADADAARTLSSGRLTSVKDLLEASTLRWPENDPAARPPPSEVPEQQRESTSDPAAARAVARAEAELDRLNAAFDDAEAAAGAAQQAQDHAAEAETAAHHDVARLRAELTAAEGHEQRTRARARTARRGCEDAARALHDIRRRREVAARRLVALTDRTTTPTDRTDPAAERR